ncbi:MAG: hypothetical protein Q9219_002595 [cf. Caloplaca sp. 3 TL-2023]
MLVDGTVRRNIISHPSMDLFRPALLLGFPFPVWIDDGRRVHIAASPEEHAHLHKTLAGVELEGRFDIFLQGSPEHLDAVREIYTHHEYRKGQLREKHGGVYNEFENVHLQLEALSNELHLLTEQGVSLDANFSKFGYDAHLTIIGDNASEEPTGFGSLKFIIVFSIGWKIWSDIQIITSWLDDMVQRFAVMFLTQRIFQALYLLWIAFVIPMVRGFMVAHVTISVVAGAIWVVSIHVDYPKRLTPIWISLFLDIIGQGLLFLMISKASNMHNRIGYRFSKWFEFRPSLDIEHKTERTNAFVTLVFGYSVVALSYQNRATNGINAFFSKVIMGLIQAFCFNWLYFEIDG